MIRAATLLAVLSAAPALVPGLPPPREAGLGRGLAQGGLEPVGRLPPTAPPLVSTPEHAKPVDLPAQPPSRGTVLEQVAGTVREVDRVAHRIVVEAGTERVTLSLDRNTMVYTSSGLGTVLDVVPGAQIRAGRNADMVAYWVQIRPTAPAPAPATVPAPAPPATPGQGTGRAGGAAAPAAEPRDGSVPPPSGGSTAPGTGPAGAPH